MSQVPHNPSEPGEPDPDLLPPQPHAPSAGKTQHKAMGRTVGRGMAWLVLNTAFAKLGSFLAQLALGWYLSKEDFGVYAIAISVAAFTQVFRDGGVRQLLIQRGPEEYESLAGPVYWMAFAFNILTAAALVAAGPIAAFAYDEPRLVNVLLVIALSIAMNTGAIILQARLTSQMRYGATSRIQLGSAIVRYAGTVLLAKFGFKELSFVLPLVGCSVFETIASYYYTRDNLWKRRPVFSRWRELFSETKWLLINSGAMSLLNQGTYFVIGFIVAKQVVGEYFFAYQLTAQIGVLLAFNTQAVLMPALSRLRHEPERHREGVVRALRILVMAAVPASVVLAANIDSLEHILWKGRWHGAVASVQLISIFFPARLILSIPSATLLSKGRFRLACTLTTTTGLGLIAVSALGAWIGTRAHSPAADPAAAAHAISPATWIALFSSIYLGVVCVIATILALRLDGISPSRVLNAYVPVWLVGCVAAGAGWATETYALPHHNAWLRCAASTAVFTIIYMVLLRALLKERIIETLQVVPARLRPLARRLLVLDAPTARPEGLKEPIV
jgi:O-antigen/teichoic acid export membrane protein